MIKAMNNNNNHLLATIDRFENGLAVLSFGNNQYLDVAKKFLPKNIKEGDVLRCEFLTDVMAKKSQAERAKHLLKEILGN